MAISSELLRVVQGKEVPVPGVWEFDQGHTEVAFEGRHLMLTRVRGTFREFSGRLVVAEVPEESVAELVIQAASLQSGFKDRDNHLRSPDFFDVANHPAISFRSTALRHVSGNRWEATGELTIRGTAQPVRLEVDFDGTVLDPWGNRKLGFLATTEVNREDWGLTWNQVLEAGGLVASKNIRLSIAAEAVLQK